MAQETLMCLFMVAREICPGLGGEGIHQQCNWGNYSLCHRLAVWPCHASPARAGVLLLQERCSPFPSSGGEAHKPASNVADPPAQRHCTRLSTHQSLGGIFFVVSHSSFAVGGLCAKNPNQPGSTSTVQPDRSYGCYPFRNLFALAFITWQRYICWESEIPCIWKVGRILQIALKRCAVARYADAGLPRHRRPALSDNGLGEKQPVHPQTPCGAACMSWYHSGVECPHGLTVCPQLVVVRFLLGEAGLCWKV